MKPSILRYHRELRGGLGEGRIWSLRTELEPEVRCLLREDWKEEAEKYIHRIAEEKKKRRPNTTKERGEGERNQEGENLKEEEGRQQEDEAREIEEGQYCIREEKVANEGNGGQGIPKPKIEEIKKMAEGV